MMTYISWGWHLCEIKASSAHLSHVPSDSSEEEVVAPSILHNSSRMYTENGREIWQVQPQKSSFSCKCSEGWKSVMKYFCVFRTDAPEFSCTSPAYLCMVSLQMQYKSVLFDA